MSSSASNPASTTTTNIMDSTQPLDSLTNEELIATVKALQKKCATLKAKTSKYEAMAHKFQRVSFAKRKKIKSFDPKTTPQRKIALKVSYFGWDYDGLQDNLGLSDTIEKILFLALSHTKLLVANVEDAEYSKCGRTDKGVSAFSQVFCLKLRSRIARKTGESNVTCQGAAARDENDKVENVQSTSNGVSNQFHNAANENMQVDEAADIEHQETEFDYCHILNRVLPNEIKVISWAYVNDPDFSARHKCVGRIYKYYFPRGNLDIKAMDASAKKLIGTHDFRNFCKINVGERLVYVRELRDFKIDFVSLPDLDSDYEGPCQMCVATINGTGFLYHQVRYMMSTLFLIGMGLEDETVLDDLLDIQKTPRRPQYGLCAEFPLVLYDCKFENLSWNLSKEAEIHLYNDFRRTWLNLAVKTALARSMMEKFSSDTQIARNALEEGKLKDFYEKDAPKSISGFLLQENWSTKQYRKIMTRQTANSLEEKIEHMENKRKRKLERMEASDL